MKSQHKLIIFAMTIAATMAACTKPDTLTGKFEGLTNDTLLIQYADLSQPELSYSQHDTIIAYNGTFTYRLTENDALYTIIVAQYFVNDRPAGGRYLPEYAMIDFVKADGKGVQITARIDTTLQELKIKGGFSTNPIHAELQNKKNEIDANIVAEEMALEQAMMTDDQTGQDKGWEQRQARNMKKRTVMAEYIRNHSDSPLAALLLYDAPIDSTEVYHNLLGDNAKSSIFSHLIDVKLDRYRQYTASRLARETIVKGGTAPDFSANDTAGNKVTLSEIEKPLRLLDFWGSWCGPCISGMPKMKEFYAKHGDKVEIIGVACNELSVEKWREAVEELQLPWINLLNEAEINISYGIEAYPTKIVIDPDGTILLRHVGEGEQFYEEMEALVKAL